MPHRKNLFSLARGKVRASWNPRNLYNLYKKSDFLRNEKTLFQQKWASKRELRAYHGEHIREGTMTRQIPKKLQGVVLPLGEDKTSSGIMAVSKRFNNPMLETDAEGNEKLKTPFAMQTFVHLEKRLDFAVFRSMFASSIRQAGQFIRQGNVTVNGVKVKHASYPLKAGDLISVKPEKVLFAAGKAKPSVEEAVKIDNRQIKKYNLYIKKCNEDPEKMWNIRLEKIKKREAGKLSDPKTQLKLQQANEAAYQAMLAKLREVCSAAILEDLLSGRDEFLQTQSDDTKVLGDKLLKLIDQHFPANGAEPVSPQTEGFLTPEAVIQFLNERSSQQSQDKLASAKDAVEGSAEHNKALEVSKASKHAIEQRDNAMANIASKMGEFPIHPKDVNHVSTIENPHTKNIVSNFLILRKAEFAGVDERKVAFAARSIIREMMTNVADSIHEKYHANQEKLLNPSKQDAEVNPRWLQLLGPLREKIDASEAAENEAEVAQEFPWQKKHLYGRQDTSKPYFTPWRFRPFISPSVIYPHHIEVDFTTCSAVYLRDPVARPGMSEVISPFPLTTHEFANLYYMKK
ncbi:37S ribosomal protein NAM9 [Yarrowia sp. C11]|nr:37S ribosomal protein NAM9 [Yarrowia sp. E02]KAG5372955.1 37S ribosomal protein NAM9 [Yarrowia sp. C11]